VADRVIGKKFEKGAKMSFPIEYCKANIGRLFIAYSYVYLAKAIQSLDEHKNAKAVVLQPFQQNKYFSSTEEAIDLYKAVRGGPGIPILFTPHGRMSEGGQFYTHRSRLLGIIGAQDDGNELDRQRKEGHWVLQKNDEDNDNVYAKNNLLIVQAPIEELQLELPVSTSTSILSPNRGKPVKAVSIPAPKLIASEYQHVLAGLP
jgi:hypothetical protein